MSKRPEPLVWTLSLPQEDVFELFRRLVQPGQSAFLLESGKGTSAIARYSIMATDPYLVITGKDDRYELRTVDGCKACQGDPLETLTLLLRNSRIERHEGLPPFFGGAIGYFSYDLVRRFGDLPPAPSAADSWPDLEFGFVELSAVIDHEARHLHLIFCPPLERLLGESRDKLYREGADRLAAMEARLTGPGVRSMERMGTSPALRPEQTRDAYIERVSRCKEYIADGDIYQANLSHRFTLAECGLATGWRGAAAHLYDRLRRVNPSPFSALLDFGDRVLVSSSPERLVRLHGTQAETRPIAGTRPRGATLVDDRRLAEELVTNAKERAEHLMLVDLGRNDLGRVCRYGTVRTDEFMVVERYSHVSHLVSNVVGELRTGLDGFDLLHALFPGGTITGVPKIRCMEIIEELEPIPRGPYTGSLGYLCWSGDLDLNIIIRTLALADRVGYIQVGAGIVADSNPSREYDETLHKAGAVIQALKDL